MDQFTRLLDQYAGTDEPSAHRKIESALWIRYGRERAICVFDMSGFSRLTDRYGVVHYLAMIRTMQRIVADVLDAHGGSLLEFHADNCFCKFDRVAPAVDAAIDINRRLAAHNRGRAADQQISVACGIEFGALLVVEGGFFAGAPVNRASRLGEDIGQSGEILLGVDAVRNLGAEHGLRLCRHDLASERFASEVMAVIYQIDPPG